MVRTKRIALATCGAIIALASYSHGVFRAPSDEVTPVTPASEPRPMGSRAAPTIKDSNLASKSNVVSMGDSSFDIGSIVARTHFAFRDRHGEYVGGDANYRTEVADGAIKITPRVPRAKRASSPREGDALTLETVFAGRKSSNASGSVIYSLAADGTVVGKIGKDIVEHLTNTAEGTQQTWSLNQRPAGDGAFEIRIRGGGESYVATTGSGIHYQDPGSGLGVAYSNAHWIDARGVDTAVGVALRGRDIVLSVPADVVDAASYPVLIDPTIGPEYGVDAPIVAPALNASEPSIGHSGEHDFDYLVVWEDTRRADAESTELWGVHVGRARGVVEPVGFIVSDPNEPDVDHGQPFVYWDDYRYIILYTVGVVDGTVDVPTIGQSIQARVIDGGGDVNVAATTTVPNTATYRVSSIAASHLSCPGDPGVADPTALPRCVKPRMTESSSVALVGWTHPETGDVVTAAFYIDDVNHIFTLASAASVFDTPGGDVDVASAPTVIALPGQAGFVALVDDFVEWFDITGIHLFEARVKAPAGYANCGRGRVMWPANADAWIATYECGASDLATPPRDIFAASIQRLPPGGVPEDAVSSGVLVGNCHNYICSSPSIAGHAQTTGGGGVNNEAIVTFTSLIFGPDEPGYISAVRLNIAPTTPTVIDTTPLFVGGTAPWLHYAPVHTDDQDSFFTTWTDVRAPNFGIDVYGAYVSWRMPGQMALQAPRFGPQDGFLISRAGQRESEPAISKCGNQYLVVYSYLADLNFDLTQVHGTILDSNGAVVKSFTIANGPIAVPRTRQDHPAVACDPTTLNWEVIWEATDSSMNPQIYGTLVSSTGALTFPNGGIFLYGTTTPSVHPSIAYGGGTFLAVWDQDNGSEILGTRINPTTGIADVSPVVIVGPSGPCGVTGEATSVATPDIDFDGNNFFVAYAADTFTCDTLLGTITIAIDVTAVSPSGTVGDTSVVDDIFATILNPPVATLSNPRIRFNGTDYVVVYEDTRASNGANYDVTAAVFDPAFATFSMLALATSSDDETLPRLAVRDSSGDVAVTYVRTAPGALFDHDVWGQSIAGNALSGAAFPIATRTDVEETLPVIDCGQPLTCVAPYREFDPTDTTTAGVDRIKARVLGF